VTGLQARNDLIHNGLYHTETRRRLDVRTLDRIAETSLSLYAELQTHWTPWLRSVVGLRGDSFRMDVRSLAGGDSGRADAQALSPKLNLVFGPWARTEVYLDYGQGFHSNDARGVVAGTDPATPLPRSTGEEIGLRTSLVPHLRTEVSLWALDLKSELVWAGDEGVNEPSGPTHRYGIELANWYTPTPWLTLDADYAWSHARFTDHEPDGPYVPEALAATFDGGVAVHDLPGALERWSAGLRLRYFGPRPLTQDNSVRSKATTLVYADLGYRATRRIKFGVSVFNLFDARASDIDYVYVSRLPGEPLAGVEDVHTHPSEPREVRASVTALF
jgi:outer membrane receptor protein involved in Fe transport